MDGGIGYLRVTTDYIDEDTFDQEPKIGFVKDPLSVYLDPDAKEPDGSDAMFAFEFDQQVREEWEERHPDLKDKVGTYPAIGSESADWITRDHIRIAIYYRRQAKKDKLYAYRSPDDNEIKFTRESEFDDEPDLKRQFMAWFRTVRDDDDSNVRELETFTVEWFKIAGDLIYERGTWHGSTIPLIKVIGEEIVIEGKLERKGHTRNLKGPQRMFNYNAAAALEYGALQTKSPWLAALESIEGNEAWKTANRDNAAVLTFNAFDSQDRPLPIPTKPQPPSIIDPLYGGDADRRSADDDGLGPMAAAAWTGAGRGVRDCAQQRGESRAITLRFILSDNLVRRHHQGRKDPA